MSKNHSQVTFPISQIVILLPIYVLLFSFACRFCLKYHSFGLIKMDLKLSFLSDLLLAPKGQWQWLWTLLNPLPACTAKWGWDQAVFSRWLPCYLTSDILNIIIRMSCEKYVLVLVIFLFILFDSLDYFCNYHWKQFLPNEEKTRYIE